MKMNVKQISMVAVLSVSVLAACGDDETEDPNGPLNWDSLDQSAKLAHMSSVMSPEMSKVFKEFDSTGFANFSCGTCHGSGATDGSYTMPSADLPALTEDLSEFTTEPDVSAFMANTVVPKFAELLEQTATTQTTMGDISCWTCHTMKLAGGGGAGGMGMGGGGGAGGAAGGAGGN